MELSTLLSDKYALPPTHNFALVPPIYSLTHTASYYTYPRQVQLEGFPNIGHCGLVGLELGIFPHLRIHRVTIQRTTQRKRHQGKNIEETMRVCFTGDRK